MTFFKNFIIGSSFPVLLPFYLGVRLNQDKIYHYEDYTLVAPLYLGLMNAIGKYLGLNSVILGLISGSIVAFVAHTLSSYDYTIAEWRKYTVYIILKHIFTFAVMIQLITYYIG